MEKKNELNENIYRNILAALFLMIFIFIIYTLITGIISFGESENNWDGVAVATSFSSGNGTEENPYTITTPEEYMYFKELIEGDYNESFKDKYYRLGNDINFNNHPIKAIGSVVPIEEEGTETEDKEIERIFEGHFNGNGYHLTNFKINEANIVNDNKYYSLFTKIKNATIENLTISNYQIIIEDQENVKIGTIAGYIDTEEEKESVIKNIILDDFILKTSELLETDSLGILFVEGTNSIITKNIFVKGEIETNLPIVMMNLEDYSNTTNIIDLIDAPHEINENIENYFRKENDIMMNKEEEEISIADIISLFNEDINSDCHWVEEDNQIKIQKYDDSLAYEVPEVARSFSFSIDKSPAITIHASGIDTANHTVYINDLSSDSDYYEGLNYTEINNTDGQLPTGNHQNLYNSNNLVTVYVKYSSMDYNDSAIYGQLSVSEDIREFIYYKKYVVNNGTLTFDLIDNPWANRPNGRAFNGWVTDYTGATVSLDIDTYTRRVTIPVNNVHDIINITFYSSWTTATTVTTTGDLSDLNQAQMQPVENGHDDLTEFYIQGTVAYNDRHPNQNNLYDMDGNKIAARTKCNNRNGCIYLYPNTSNTYSATTTYYLVTPINNYTATIEVADVHYQPFTYYNSSANTAGYFIRVTSGSDNVYSNTGEKLNSCSGTCYKLLQFSDGTVDSDETYYYLATRDTNIFAPSENITTSNISYSRPMTITGINNGVDNSTRRVRLNRNMSIENDIRIEHITLYVESETTNTDTFSTTTYLIIGNYNNVKIGRGIKRYGDYITASSFVGGNASSTSSLEKYSLIVESGWYQNASAVGYSTAYYHYVEANVILGSDYDRIDENNNKLIVYYCYCGTWASYLYNTEDEINTYNKPAVLTIVKSGSFGENHYDYAAGIYVGGRNRGTHYALREIIVEGGSIYNLLGGPMSDDSRANKNDVIINVKGGVINMLFGGAGVSNTVGNRIINVSGGVVNYSVLGGSNAYEEGSNSSNPYGKIDGETLIYIGGNAEIGTKDDTLYNIGSGNVFGAGNGRDGELDVGAVNNSHIIIGPNATIKGDVYGGGNYGAVGGNLTGNSSSPDGQSSSSAPEGGLYYDNTTDNNIRYYGTNPSNYIQFNGENYRIIGLFNNLTTGNGTENLVRIIKTSSITSRAWSDTNMTGTQTTNTTETRTRSYGFFGTQVTDTYHYTNYYKNYYNYFVKSDDTKSSMYNYLNSTYYNGINYTYRDYIESVNWNLSATSANQTTTQYYTAERGNTSVTYKTGQNQTNNGTSKTSDNFKIGLFYPSDYGYANNDTSCLTENLNNYSNACIQNNWLNYLNNAWTMVPTTNVEDDTREYQVSRSGSNRNGYTYTMNRYYHHTHQNLIINSNRVAVRDMYYTAYNNDAQNYYNTANVYPSFFLKENITISSGTGTVGDPYIIGTSGKKLTDIILELMNQSDDDYNPAEDSGNYIDPNDYQAKTYIHMIGGTIEGSIYGAGNSNGAGNNNATNRYALAQIKIDIDNGDINGSIYGGSNEKGKVYGDVIINTKNGTIGGSIYGGGKGGYSSSTNYGTYVSRNIDVNIGTNDTTSLTISGNVYGGSAFGTVNGVGQNEEPNENYVRVKVTKGTVRGSVFGGGEGDNTHTPNEYGNVYVHMNGGNVTKVFGGNDSKGEPSNFNIVYLNSGTIGNAFGGGNQTGQTNTDIRLQGSTITGNLYGGSNQSGTIDNTRVKVKSGSVTEVFGGNNLGGNSVTTHVNVTGGTISSNIFGGGNQAESTTTNVDINGVVTITNVYGGGNQAGVSDSTNVNIAKGSITGVYGGSNQSGTVGTTNVNIVPTTVTNYYDDYSIEGSGLEVSFNYRFTSAQYQTEFYPEYQTIVDITPVFRNTSEEDYDEWSVTLNIPDSRFYAHDGDANIIVNGESYTWNQDDRWWGTNPIPANNTYSPSLPLRILYKGTESDFRLIYDLEATDGSNGIHKTTNDPDYVSPLVGGGINIGAVYGGNNIGGNVNTSNITIDNGIIGEVYGGGNQVGLTTSNVEITGGSITSAYGGSNRNGNVGTSNVTINGANSPTITELYGGNNLGGETTNVIITADGGNVTTLFGGGNRAIVGQTNLLLENLNATTIYGGGNSAGVRNDVTLVLRNSTVIDNIYGGGNQGVVQGNTDVLISSATVQGNAFAGGNGATAIIYGDSTITLDGTTVIGTPTTVAPDNGCVFGSGNAAATGLSSNKSVATLNIVGGEIYGNVYGGPKMAVVYGTTETRIGTNAVNNNHLTESDIKIHGTVFGGGESNASGSETYDYTFISVTDGIDVLIDGLNYDQNNHQFIINGSIFGSGNASSSSGDSNITINNLGSKTSPNKAISIQRATNLVISSSVIELSGTTDRTNEYSDIVYSLNLIDKMTIQNNTTLLLKHNANMLKELYSGLKNGNQAITPATVTIDSTNKTVTRNVDNRIYMIPGENLNVAVNQNANAYGKVNGMTFFGMYTVSDSQQYRFGLYEDTYDYGDSANAGLEIVGGSYVLGLRYDDHDITKDGFYTNYLKDGTFDEIVTNYIDPTPIGETGFRWTVGFEAIDYTVPLQISKYFSLGTYELSLIDFANGNSTFTVLGFDSTNIDPEISLIDQVNIPRVGRTVQEANSLIGLAMKIETQEWTSTGTVKLLGANGGSFTGKSIYQTDNRKVAPSLMFYSYHTKNFSRIGDMGSGTITMQVSTPKNAIEDEITFITITIEMEGKDFGDGSYYDGSITYDKKYEMPAATTVNITNKSQFTAYFSLTDFFDNFSDVYGIGNVNYHAIITSNPLPVGTMITMLDYGAKLNRPEYYYFTIDQTVYDQSVAEYQLKNEVSYRLNNFIKMDSTSTNNKYNDQAMNLIYYDPETDLVDEEFIIIVDFKDTNVSGDHLNNKFSFELRNEDDWAYINVVSAREPYMFYNTYESSNIVLSQIFTDRDDYLYYNANNDFSYKTKILYNETENKQSVIDTNYEYSNMGLNISFLKDGEIVSSSLLVGSNIVFNNQEYYADGDGVYRIKLSDKVSNIERNASIMINKNLPSGNYTMRYVLFASPDGLHNSKYENSVTQDFPVTIVSADNAITATCTDDTKLVNGETGKNHADSKINTYRIQYTSQLANPNVHMEILKRNIDDIDTTQFTSVPFNTLFKNNLNPANDNEVYVDMLGSTDKILDLELVDELTSGTYKIIFKLYDNNQVIDQDIKYVIVTKN